LPKRLKRELVAFLLTLSLTTALSGVIAPKKAYAQEREKSRKEKKMNFEELNIKDILGEDTEKNIDENQIKKIIENFKNSDFKGETFFSREYLEFKGNSESDGKFSENSNGKIPTKGDNIAMRGITTHLVKETSGSEEEYADTFNDYFEVGNLESEVEPTGEPFIAKGLGRTAQEAIGHALKLAGERIECLARVNRDMSTFEGEKVFIEEYFNYTEISFNQAIESYEVISAEEIEEDGFRHYQAELKIQPGEITK